MNHDVHRERFPVHGLALLVMLGAGLASCTSGVSPGSLLRLGGLTADSRASARLDDTRRGGDTTACRLGDIAAQVAGGRFRSSGEARVVLAATIVSAVLEAMDASARDAEHRQTPAEVGTSRPPVVQPGEQPAIHTDRAFADPPLVAPGGTVDLVMSYRVVGALSERVGEHRMLYLQGRPLLSQPMAHNPTIARGAEQSRVAFRIPDSADTGQYAFTVHSELPGQSVAELRATFEVVLPRQQAAVDTP